MNGRFRFSVLTSVVAAGCVLVSGALSSFAQTNSQASGNWSTGSTWSAGEPGFSSTANIISHTVAIDQVGEVANLLNIGTASGQTGNLEITDGSLDIGDFNPGTVPDGAIRVGQAAGSTGNLTMSGGTVFIAEDIGGVDGSGDLIIGENGTGTVTISGGTFTAGDEILLGLAAGSSGTLTVSGGTVATGLRDIRVGFGDGHGELNISGTGVVDVAGWVFTSAGRAGSASDGEDATSVINQSGGELNVGGLFVLGAQGNSTFNHSGGAFTADLFIVSDNFNNTGTNTGVYNISGSATLDTDLVLWVGAWPGSVGTINQTGGDITTGALTVGRDGTGTYNMSGGTWTQTHEDGATANNHLIVGQVGDHNVGRQAVGDFNQTGGVVTVTTGLFLGDYDNSDGTYRISGGTLNVNGTGNHNADPIGAEFEQFIGDVSVGGALASNARLDRIDPTGEGDAQGQALDAKGTFIVSGSAATINIAGNFLANPDDKHAFRKDDIPGDTNRRNSATLGFEIFDSSGTSLIDVAGVADLDGAVIDMDLMGGYTPAVNTVFDLLEASMFGATGTGTTQNVGTGTGFSLAPEDVGSWSLAVVAGAGVQTLQATFLGAMGLAGDFDQDGDVDGRDFLVWQRNPAVGNLSDWQANYGMGNLAAIGSVPEPASLTLLGMLGICAVAVRRKDAR